MLCNLGQQPLQQLSILSPSKVGLAIIVSNDYANNDTKLTKLHGTHKDAEKMLTTFSKLGCAVFHCNNMTYYELTDTIDRIAAFLPPSSCKHLVFVLSGYGAPRKQHEVEVSGDEEEDSSEEDEKSSGDEQEEDMSGQFYTQEGWTISIVEILEAFHDYKHPKLFLLNLCPSLLSVLEWFDLENFLHLDHLTEDDNFLFACSVLPYRELQSGSLWIELLSEAFINKDNDIKIILSDVSSTLRELYSSIPLFEARVYDNLTDSVNFLAESPIDVAMPLQQSKTQSFVVKLQEHCEEFQLDDPDYVVLPTQRGGGFYCTVTISGEPYTGAIRMDEEEAKESAAETFLNFLSLQ